MQLTVLGGSAASPGPGQGCSGYIVAADDYRVVLDTGPNTLGELRKHLTLAQIDGLVMSHLHSDHTLDLVPLRYGLKYGPGAHHQKIPLWLPPGGLEFLKRLADAFAIGAESQDSFFSDVFELAEYDPARELKLGPFAIIFKATRHFVPCWAMRLTTGEKSLVYLADTGPYDPLPAFARDADLLICEATLPAGHENSGENTGHLTARQAGKVAELSRARCLLLTHMWSEFDENDSVRAAAEGYGGPILVAKPGLLIDV
jgi:ribonuclease BN (tRNA processing enzyme)